MYNLPHKKPRMMRVALFLWSFIGVVAADLSTGTTFLVAIPYTNTNDKLPQLIIVLADETVTTTSVRIKYSGTDVTLTVAQGTPLSVDLSIDIRCMTSGIHDNGVLVKSDNDVTVQIQNFESNGHGDTMRGFALSDESTEYYLVHESTMTPVLTVVAIYENTVVWLEKRKDEVWESEDEVTLGVLKTYTNNDLSDLSERRIRASSPVSVYMGGTIYDGVSPTGEVFLCLPPVAFVGQTYFTSPTALVAVTGSSAISVDMKVISLHDSNTVKLHSHFGLWIALTTVTLGDGELHQGSLTGPNFNKLTCTHACMVVQHVNSAGMQPYMILVPDADSFVNKASFAAGLDWTFTSASAGRSRYLVLFTAALDGALTPATSGISSAASGSLTGYDSYRVHWWELTTGNQQISVDFEAGGSTDVFSAWLVSQASPYGYGCVSAWGGDVGPLTPPPVASTVADTTTTEALTTTMQLTTHAPTTAEVSAPVADMSRRHFYLATHAYLTQSAGVYERTARSRLECANFCQKEATISCTSFSWNKGTRTCILHDDVMDADNITSAGCVANDACVPDTEFQLYYDREAHPSE